MRINKAALIPLLSGLIIGAMWFVIIRALFFYPEPVHFHANFAVFINGQQASFDSPVFYEEVQACSQDETGNPRGRAHLHQPNPDVVHIHDDAVTWGNFFENIGWSLGDDFLRADDGLYRDGQGGDLVFMLNGFTDRQIANRAIRSEDRLLVSFGSDNDNESVVQAQFEQVPSDSKEFNEKFDPASCSGSAEPSVWQRLKFGLTG